MNVCCRNIVYYSLVDEWKAMNLVSYSIRTKGMHAFTRRLTTVFSRFGFSEKATQRALHAIMDSLKVYDAGPTFFIPAVVLRRHPALLAQIARRGAEIGVHGYVHNDYRSLNTQQQRSQTQQAVSVFEETGTAFRGFRNPYLGWTEEALPIFTDLGFSYESNEAILHDVVDLDSLSSQLQQSFAKSLLLFQAIPCTSYALRPHFEGSLVRIPTSIPDDEMLFDRLRITNPREVGHLWCRVMQRVYDRAGLYTLNLHPERGILCKQALDILLDYAVKRPRPIWITRIGEVADWWRERSKFRFHITSQGPGRWKVEAACTSRAAILARYLTIEDQPATAGGNEDFCVDSHSFTVQAAHCPCIALSLETPQEVLDFLQEQGYPARQCTQEEAHTCTLHLDLPAGLGSTREEQRQRRCELLDQVEKLARPLLRFGYWPRGKHAALAISGDIDSVTVQDFFLRIIEVYLSR
jgi:peptidoglycan/xylan/chitin deacetylase (PgdA/CDA1 family)